MRLPLAALLACAFALPAHAGDALLDEAVAFSGQILHLETGVPGLIIAGVRGGDSAVFGFGEIAKGSGLEPDGDTSIGVGSITKSFTGLVLAQAVADGDVDLTSPAGPHVGLVDDLPERDGHRIRMVDLATHASGLARELAPIEGVEKYSDDSYAKNLAGDPLLFTPGTGMLYSNIGFDVLGMALSGATGKPYAELLREKVLEPIGLGSTGYDRPGGHNIMAGYDWNGEPMPSEVPNPNRYGASQLHTTANDMVKYLQWNFDRFGEEGAEMRAISHAAHLVRDGLSPVYGLDESGRMDAMGLGWVIMMPEGNRPLIIQKAGGSDGIFSYIAFAPHRDAGVFIAINQFDFSASMAMAQMANDLIATLAPR